MPETRAQGTRAQRRGDSPLESGKLASDKKGAKEAGATIVFVDESGFSELPNVRRTWSPRGLTPIIRHHFNWDRLHGIFAIECPPDGGEPDVLMYLQPVSVDGPSIIAFLDALHQEIPGQMQLLWDGLAAHRSNIVKEHISQCSDWLKVERFPAYAPELNPVEYLLSAIKGKDVANLCAVSIDHIARKLEDAVSRLAQDVGVIKGCLRASTLFHDTG